jgi:hypothetical protein
MSRSLAGHVRLIAGTITLFVRAAQILTTTFAGTSTELGTGIMMAQGELSAAVPKAGNAISPKVLNAGIASDKLKVVCSVTVIMSLLSVLETRQ